MGRGVNISQKFCCKRTGIVLNNSSSPHNFHSDQISPAPGIISTAQSLSLCEKVTVSSFCRRRLPVILVRLRMAQSVSSCLNTNDYFVVHMLNFLQDLVGLATGGY